MPDIQTITELFARLKPYILGLISTVGGSGGPFAPSPHDISGAHHSGSVTDVQIPQAALLDGSRQFTGNVTISDGKTFDGVDVSVLKSSYDTHAGATAVAGHGNVGAHNHTTDAAGGVLPHSGLSGITANDHHNQVHGFLGSDHSVSGSAGWVVGFTSPAALGMFETSSAPGAASKLLKTDAAGGIEIQSLTLNGNLIGRHLLPQLPDTYDLGSSTAPWRKGWLSELDAVLFAKNTRALVGGWLTIGKGEGALAAAAAAADTSIDFGQTMTNGQFVELRTSLAVEYVQVGSLVSGTRYNVTRNLDGTGANDWPMGAVYLILGVSGDGRIELNAYDSPRMSVIRQRATYNAQTETLRFGDLNGGWGFSTETWGAAFGAYANGSPNVIITPDKVALRNYNTDVIKLTGSGASFEAPISLGAGGGIYQGSGTFAGPTTGLKLYNNAGIGELAGYADSRKLYALNDKGMIVYFNATSRTNFYWYREGYLNSAAVSVIGQDMAGQNALILTAMGNATSTGANSSRVSINAYDVTTGGITLELNSATQSANVTGLMYIQKGLWVGAVATPTNGCIHLEGSIRKSVTVGARVHRESNYTIANGTWTPIPFQYRRWDDPDNNLWNGWTAFFPRIPGQYHIWGNINFVHNATGERDLGIRLNGTRFLAIQNGPPAHYGNNIHVDTIWKFTQNDINDGHYVELCAFQNSGGNLDLYHDAYHYYQSEFAIARIP